MIDQASVPSLMGSTVRDSAGEKIGKVRQVYLDDTTGQPEWVTVHTGLFGTKESFVPLAAARVEGDELVVDIPKGKVRDAPRIDEDGHLSEEQENELYSYYGVSQGPFGRQAPTDAGVSDTYAGTEAGRTGEGYPETDAGADYATTDRATGVAPTGVPTDYGSTDQRTGMASAAGAAAAGTVGTGTPATGAPEMVGDDPTGTPVGDQDVAEAMSGRGFVETDAGTGEEVGPDFARGEDASVTGTGGGTDSGPDFARGEDASVTGAPSALGPDFARGEDRESRPGYEAEGAAGTDEPGAARRRLRRWMVTDERSTTPVVDESGEVIGEVSSEQVDVRPVDEDRRDTP
jgi:sporulation protein YlmC with PRC-barrel domain